MTVSGVDSARVRVHLYERCFRGKPARRVLVDEVDARVIYDIAAHAAVSRMERGSAGRQ